MDGYNALSGTPHSTLSISQDRAFARKPTRDIIRDAGGLVEEAFEIYKKARLDGRTPKKPSPQSSTRWNSNVDASIHGQNVTSGRRHLKQIDRLPVKTIARWWYHEYIQNL